MTSEVADSAAKPSPMDWEEHDKGLLYPRKPRQESLLVAYSLFQGTRIRCAPVNKRISLVYGG